MTTPSIEIFLLVSIKLEDHKHHLCSENMIKKFIYFSEVFYYTHLLSEKNYSVGSNFDRDLNLQN